MPMLEGSCACGRVRYQIQGELIGPLTHCHCWRCRKHSGASFGTTAGVRADEFGITEGQSLLAHWQSSPGVYRYFASCCGSPIFKRETENPEVYGFRLGTLDSDPGDTVSQHYMIDAKAPWVDLELQLDEVIGGDGPFPGGERT